MRMQFLAKAALAGLILLSQSESEAESSTGAVTPELEAAGP